MSETVILASIFSSMDGYDIFISVGLFLCVTLLVMALFGGGGKAQLSPQREAALATGHSDRRTVFESPLLGSLAWSMLLISHRLTNPKLKEWVRKKLIAAGSPNFYTPEEFVALSLMIGSVAALILETFHMLLTGGTFSFSAVIVGMLGGFCLSLYNLHDKATKRVRQISRRVPYALDLIALAMGAGATFTEAVRTIVRDESEDPFKAELKAMLAEMDLGTTRRRSLQNLAARVPLDSLHTIVASIIQAEELGTPLSDVLHSQATLLRLQRSVRAENLAAVASIRILVPCLLIVMAVVLAAFAPAIIHILRQGGL